MSDGTEAAAILAPFVAATTYDRLSPEARISAKRCILDTLGITAAASTLGLGHKALNDMVRRSGGAPEAGILGFGGKAPVWLAALVNGAMARAIDFDDSHDESMTHPSSVVVPAALAMAEKRGVSGKELIAAVAVGNEILCRLGLSAVRAPGGQRLDRWFPTSVFGIFGGAAACCRVLSLDAETVRSAFGIALFEAAGTLEAFSASGQRGMMRGMVTGFTARSATMVTSMAECGITGVPDSIDGEFGLFRVYYGGSSDRDALLADLGDNFVSADIGMKPWPTCRYTHSYIDATLQIVNEEKVDAGDIREIRIYVAGYAQSRCEPLEQQRQAHNFNHAGHALPYLVAAAAGRRRMELSDLIGRLDDPQVLALAARVVPHHDPRFSIESRIGPSRVEIELAGDQVLSRQLEVVYGSAANPMSWDELAAKFRACVEHSAKPLGGGEADRLVERIADLESVEDVREITGVLS